VHTNWYLLFFTLDLILVDIIQHTIRQSWYYFNDSSVTNAQVSNTAQYCFGDITSSPEAHDTSPEEYTWPEAHDISSLEAHDTSSETQFTSLEVCDTSSVETLGPLIKPA